MDPEALAIYEGKHDSPMAAWEALPWESRAPVLEYHADWAWALQENGARNMREALESGCTRAEALEAYARGAHAELGMSESSQHAVLPGDRVNALYAGQCSNYTDPGQAYGVPSFQISYRVQGRVMIDAPPFGAYTADDAVMRKAALARADLD